VSAPPQFSRTRKLTILAQDPTVRKVGGEILTAQVIVPAEELQPGPMGYRVQVIDYDSSRDVYYAPPEIPPDVDPFENQSPDLLITSPQFHAQNVYALVMRTLARFEFALGRRISWGFYGHHLKVVPHAFADANAFYSPDDQALFFGYFPATKGDGTVFTCLSHDVVVHETTHALLDGLRRRFTDPSSPDQAAFHEGFADIVALLSVFSLRDILAVVIDQTPGPRSFVRKEAVETKKLRKSILLGLAEQMGREIPGIRGDALRRSVLLEPSPDHYLIESEFMEPHRRGEILVAAFMNAFLEIWERRLAGLGQMRPGYLSRERVVEEGAEIADQLLTMAIRALDYTPPVHIEFGDVLSALITGHKEVDPDDQKYYLREMLLESFHDYGIQPASKAGVPGHWAAAPEDLRYERSHYESMRNDPDEVFRFVWENRRALEFTEEAYSRVLSVRPCLRIAPDGFALREVVAEFLQVLDVKAGELQLYGIRKPDGMPDPLEISLQGGGALVFDEYGQLKYNIHNRVLNADRQSKRLDYLWRNGFFRKNASSACAFSRIHRQRAAGLTSADGEGW
jgi:hypothetical protein